MHNGREPCVRSKTLSYWPPVVSGRAYVDTEKNWTNAKHHWTRQCITRKTSNAHHTPPFVANIVPVYMMGKKTTIQCVLTRGRHSSQYSCLLLFCAPVMLYIRDPHTQISAHSEAVLGSPPALFSVLKC